MGEFVPNLVPFFLLLISTVIVFYFILLCRWFILKKYVPRKYSSRALGNGSLAVHTIQRSFEEHPEKTKEAVFEMFRENNEDVISVQSLITALEATGVQPHSDPRLKEFVAGLEKTHRESGVHGSPDAQTLSKDKFMELISPNLSTISRALRHDLMIPDFSSFQTQMEAFYVKCKENRQGQDQKILLHEVLAHLAWLGKWTGQLSSYLPQFAKQNPETWAASFCSVDGQRFSFGEASTSFPLHSLSKPTMYALALNELGGDLVHEYVGQEPSGRNVNELILDDSRKPHNPMISAGAILVGALIQTLCKPDMQLAERFDFVVNYYKRLSGGGYVGFNNSVFLAQKTAGDRNYALGFYLKEHNCYPKGTDLRSLIDFYHQCSSLETDCNSMSVIAATFANGGVCPLTGDMVLNPDAVRDVLSLMHSCGVTEYSGQFAFKVGLPAKSAVTGAMMVVIPNVMGVCTWSPLLDKLNNSCRGIQFFEEIVKVFSFHHYENPKHAKEKKDPRKDKNSTRALTIVNLLYSASRGDVDALTRHKLSGIDMSLSDYDKRTALHLASAEGHLHCVMFLVEKCSLPLEPTDRWGKTPLDEARAFERQNVVEYLETKIEEQRSDQGSDLILTDKGWGTKN